MELHRFHKVSLFITIPYFIDRSSVSVARTFSKSARVLNFEKGRASVREFGLHWSENGVGVPAIPLQAEACAPEARRSGVGCDTRGCDELTGVLILVEKGVAKLTSNRKLTHAIYSQ